jgi:hypothetical protein
MSSALPIHFPKQFARVPRRSAFAVLFVRGTWIPSSGQSTPFSAVQFAYNLLNWRVLRE